MHTHDHNHNHEDIQNIKVAFFLNLSFTIIELIGGALTNSMAILSDAVHDFGDSLSLGLSWYFQKLSKKPKTNTYTYGYKRFSLLGALINSVVLLVGSIIILVNAVPRLLDPQQPHTKGMLILAVFGVIINGLAVFRLQHGKSINERVVSLHLLEDVLGWVAVLIGATVMHFVNAPIIDPILSIAITIYILSNVFKNLKQSMRIILQGSPLKIEADQVEKILLSHPDIQDIHDLHIWSIDGEYNILTAHLVLKHTEITYPQGQKIKADIRQMMQSQGIQHCTIELELPNEDCTMLDC